jgi:hypothetical protein
MRPFLFLAGLVVAIAAFASPYLSSVASGFGGGGDFPKAGTYTVVTDRFGHLSESKVLVQASSRSAFENLVAGNFGSRCSNRQVSIGGGSFKVSITCGTPDGDINNVVLERHGTYTPNSIEIVSTTKLWGVPMVETSTYRLRDAAAGDATSADHPS